MDGGGVSAVVGSQAWVVSLEATGGTRVPAFSATLVLCSSCLRFVEFAQAAGVVGREVPRQTKSRATPRCLSQTHEHPTWGVGG